MLKLYSDELEIVSQYPLTVEFKNELALDAGGVLRDAFSAFKNLFNGSFFLHPATC